MITLTHEQSQEITELEEAMEKLGVTTGLAYDILRKEVLALKEKYLDASEHPVLRTSGPGVVHEWQPKITISYNKEPVHPAPVEFTEEDIAIAEKRAEIAQDVQVHLSVNPFHQD